MIPYEKWHGAGNDFILITHDHDHPIPSPRELARRECDRATGTGADGILLLEPTTDTTPPRVRMTLYQPDGSTAAMCGNGARCAAKWLADHTHTTRVTVETPAGTHPATITDTSVTIDMGPYSFAPDDIPLAQDTPMIDHPLEGLRVTAVTTGVPHAVAFTTDTNAVDLDRIGPRIRHHDRFPAGTNVTIAAPHEDTGYHQRTYERGVEGETVACGTGAVAIAAVAVHHHNHPHEHPLAVHPPGGQLRVTIHPDDTATLHGPVTKTTTGELPRPRP